MHQVAGFHAEQAALDSDSPAVVCKHCGTSFKGNFCPRCGQTAFVQRITVRSVMHSVFDLFTNFDGKFYHTFFELMFRPGYMVHDYINGHRICYVNPFQMLACLTTIYLVVSYLLPIETSAGLFIELAEGPDAIIKEGTLPHWLYMRMQDIMGNKLLMELGAVVLFAPSAWLCFHWTEEGKKMNLAEHFLARVFFSCQMLVVATLSLPMHAYMHHNVGSGNSYSLFTILLLGWDYCQLMRIDFRRSLRLCLAAIVLMLGVLTALALAVGYLYLHLLDV